LLIVGTTSRAYARSNSNINEVQALLAFQDEDSSEENDEENISTRAYATKVTCD